MKTRYILVNWPECQFLEEHDRFDECFFIAEIYAFMCPEDLYYEIFKNDNYGN